MRMPINRFMFMWIRISFIMHGIKMEADHTRDGGLAKSQVERLSKLQLLNWELAWIYLRVIWMKC